MQFEKLSPGGDANKRVSFSISDHPELQAAAAKLEADRAARAAEKAAEQAAIENKRDQQQKVVKFSAEDLKRVREAASIKDLENWDQKKAA